MCAVLADQQSLPRFVAVESVQADAADTARVSPFVCCCCCSGFSADSSRLKVSKAPMSLGKVKQKLSARWIARDWRKLSLGREAVSDVEGFVEGQRP